MAIYLGDNIDVQIPKPLDAKYLNNTIPYTSISAVNTAIVSTLRSQGLTVNINGVEYWYSAGILDTDLVIKDSGIASTGLTLASNGLTKVGSTVKLGGTITGTTTITDSRGGSAVGIQYGADYCANFTARSLVDAAYVTGKTHVINSVGTIGQVIYRDSTHLTGCTNMIYCDALPSFAFGRTNVVTGADSGSFGGTSSCVSGACSVIIGGISNAISTGNVRAAIIGGNSIKLTGTTYIDTVAVPSLAIMTTPTTCLGDVLTYDIITKKIGKTTLSALGGLTGATNGLTASSQNVCLGGALIAGTSITGAQALCLGTAASKLALLDINSASLLISSSGATFTDLTLAAKQGIKYASDYSLTYDSRSLVDKGYVDTIATGLNVHTAANLTTTGATIGLSGVTVIDGVTTTTGMRILVRNQTNGALNGIYSASTGTWSRTNDYDFSPAGEIRNGDLIPVTNGLTQNNTLWALTTQSPIVSGDTLTFSLFGTVIDVQAGAGIAITQVGSIHTVCVNLGSNSGLNTSSGLVIDSSIAGCALTLNAGVLCVNAASCGTVPAISVGFNTAECLVVAISDIRGAVCAITGATNGLTAGGNIVCLGGALNGTTTINGAQTLRVNTCYFNVTGTTGLCLSTGSGVITDTGNKGGLQYAADYCQYVVDRSLVDAQWVNRRITGGTTVLTASNGLTKQSNNNVVLGGALTGETTINGAQTLRINVTTLSLSGNTTFGLTYGTGTITNVGGTTGLVYAGNYGATNVALSIPDAQWVTGKTATALTNYYTKGQIDSYTGQTDTRLNVIEADYVTGATNGLTKSGSHDVCLGGALTSTVTINGAQNLRINVTTLDLSGNTSLNLTGTAVTLQTTPPTGLITDSVLVWNSSDKQIKTVAGASLGDKNNVYNKTIITASATGTTASTYVILVSGSSSTSFTLPSAPLAGQAFKIKDVCGNALTNNIVVNAGSGKTIDGSQCALINTDYGALELVYGATNKWYSLAFIN